MFDNKRKICCCSTFWSFFIIRSPWQLCINVVVGFARLSVFLLVAARTFRLSSLSLFELCVSFVLNLIILGRMAHRSIIYQKFMIMNSIWWSFFLLLSLAMKTLPTYVFVLASLHSVRPYIKHKSLTVIAFWDETN